MQKLVFLSILSLFTTIVLSQDPVEIDSLGNLSIGESSFFESPLRVIKNQSDFQGPMIFAEVKGDDPVNDIAIFGKSTVSAGRGIGGFFLGGFQGVKGTVNAENFGAQYEGVRGEVTGGGPGVKYGVYGVSLASTGGSGVFGHCSQGEIGSISYGVRGLAVGSGRNYGVYGSASNGTENWAGYFDGDGHFADFLTIGTTDKDHPLHIKMDQSNFTDALVHVEVLGAESVDDIAIRGISAPTTGKGIGGYFEGGKFGLQARVSSGESGILYGSHANVVGGSGDNIGSYGQASGSGNCFGVYGWAAGGGTNYGVFGGAAFGTDNWAGYFNGRSHFTDFVGIGELSPQDQLHITGTNAGLRIENPSGNYGGLIINSGNEFNLYNSGVGAIRFIGNNMERMRIGGNGNVGINTTAVTNSNLHISGLENNGTNSALRITSGGQYLMLDGNEIDAFGFGMFLNNNSSGNITLANGGGRVGIKESSPETTLHIKHPVKTSGLTNAGLKLELGTTGDQWTFYIESSSGDGDLLLYTEASANQTIGCFDGVSGNYSATSDARLKKNVKSIPFALENIKKLNPVKYHYKTQNNMEQKYIGFLAQEVQAIYPEMVTYNAESDVHHLNYDGFSVIAIKAIQELSEENDRLSERINSLEAKIEALMKSK